MSISLNHVARAGITGMTYVNIANNPLVFSTTASSIERCKPVHLDHPLVRASQKAHASFGKDHVRQQHLLRTYTRDAFSLGQLVAMKQQRRSIGLPSTISVIIPARNCEKTIGHIVSSLHRDLMVHCSLVDEILVVDHDSTDSTARIARAAGARVLPFATTPPMATEEESGKGTVMRKGVWAADGDIVVFCDGDHVRFDSFKVWRLIGPLLSEENVMFTKAYYDGYEGGRTTEAMARPLISLIHPELAGLQQPLTGEQAGLRHVFTEIWFPSGWSTEYRMLDQIVRHYGAGAIAQVDVEYKEHGHGDNRHINRQAFEILHAAMASGLAEAGLAMPIGWGHDVLMPGPDAGSVVGIPARTHEWAPLDTLPGFAQRELERHTELAAG